VFLNFAQFQPLLYNYRTQNVAQYKYMPNNNPRITTRFPHPPYFLQRFVWLSGAFKVYINFPQQLRQENTNQSKKEMFDILEARIGVLKKRNPRVTFIPGVSLFEHIPNPAFLTEPMFLLSLKDYYVWITNLKLADKQINPHLFVEKDSNRLTQQFPTLDALRQTVIYILQNCVFTSQELGMNFDDHVFIDEINLEVTISKQIYTMLLSLLGESQALSPDSDTTLCSGSYSSQNECFPAAAQSTPSTNLSWAIVNSFSPYVESIWPLWFFHCDDLQQLRAVGMSIYQEIILPNPQLHSQISSHLMLNELSNSLLISDSVLSLLKVVYQPKILSLDLPQPVNVAEPTLILEIEPCEPVNDLVLEIEPCEPFTANQDESSSSSQPEASLSPTGTRANLTPSPFFLFTPIGNSYSSLDDHMYEFLPNFK